MKNPNHTDHDIIEYLISLVEHSGDKDGNLYTMGMEGDEYLLVLIRMKPGVHGFPFRRQ